MDLRVHREIIYGEKLLTDSFAIAWSQRRIKLQHIWVLRKFVCGPKSVLGKQPAIWCERIPASRSPLCDQVCIALLHSGFPVVRTIFPVSALACARRIGVSFMIQTQLNRE